jgi:hypothetical protein
MKAREALLLFSLLSTLCLSYGQDAGTSAQPSDPPPAKAEDFSSPLNGTWHITGVDSRDPGRAKSPFVALSIEADGDQLYGKGVAKADCSNAMGNGGGGLVLAGKIAPDGSFEAHFSPRYGDSVVQFTIHGTVPTPGGEAWSGTHTLKNPQNPTARANCFYDESAAFTATRYPPFTGTYSGTIGGKAFGAHPTVTIQVVQGDPGHYSANFQFR